MEVEGDITVRPRFAAEADNEPLRIRQEVPIRASAAPLARDGSDNDEAEQDRDNGVQMVRLNLVLQLKSSCCVHCPRR